MKISSLLTPSTAQELIRAPGGLMEDMHAPYGAPAPFASGFEMSLNPTCFIYDSAETLRGLFSPFVSKTAPSLSPSTPLFHTDVLDLKRDRLEPAQIQVLKEIYGSAVRVNDVVAGLRQAGVRFPDL